MRRKGRMRVLTAAMAAVALTALGLVGHAWGDDQGRAEAPPDPAGAEQPERPDGADSNPAAGDDATAGNPEDPTSLPADLSPAQIGVIDIIDAVLGRNTERSRVLHYPGSGYVKVHFADLNLAPGDTLKVSNPTETEVYTYWVDPETGQLTGDVPVHLDDTGGFWAMSVTGDTALVSLEHDGALLPPVLSGHTISIDKIARGLTDSELKDRDAAAPAAPGSEESTCGGDEKADVACFKSEHPTAYERSRAVAKLLIGGTSLCTGFRVGPNNRMLTNNHCIGNTWDARNTEVWFNFECRACDDHESRPVTKVYAEDVIATDPDLDYTLFTVDDFDAIQEFGYLQLARNQASSGEAVYVPQHPHGDTKHLSMYSDVDGGACQVDDPSYDGYLEGSDVSYYCDTSPGSSGAPVISRRTHRVVALHHLGGCPNSGVRGDLLYRELADLL